MSHHVTGAPASYLGPANEVRKKRPLTRAWGSVVRETGLLARTARRPARTGLIGADAGDAP